MSAPIVQEQNADGAWVDIPAVPLETAAVVADVDATEETAAAAPPVVAAKLVDDKPKGKPRNDAEARIDELTRHRRDAERRAEAAEARIRELEARTAPAEPKPAAKPAETPATDAEPDPNDLTKYPEGQFDRKFLKDNARWEARQEIQQAAERQRVESDRERRYQGFDTRKNALVEKIVAARTADPEFTNKLHPSVLKAVTTSVPASLLDPRDQPTLGNMLVEQLLDSGAPTEFLLKVSDPAVLQRLATLHPHQAVLELARLEASLTPAAPATGPAREEKPKSKATAPISPVTGSPQVSASEEPGDDASDDEWYRWRQASQAKLRKRA